MTVFAILLKSTKDPQLSLFVSSIAASHSVESVGNSAKINPEIILKTIQHLMK